MGGFVVRKGRGAGQHNDAHFNILRVLYTLNVSKLYET